MSRVRSTKMRLRVRRLIAFIELGTESLEKLFQLRDKIRGQIADLSAHACITGGETRAGEQLT